jgi:hypothetical protein
MQGRAAAVRRQVKRLAAEPSRSGLQVMKEGDIAIATSCPLHWEKTRPGSYLYKLNSVRQEFANLRLLFFDGQPSRIFRFTDSRPGVHSLRLRHQGRVVRKDTCARIVCRSQWATLDRDGALRDPRGGQAGCRVFGRQHCPHAARDQGRS